GRVRREPPQPVLPRVPPPPGVPPQRLDVRAVGGEDVGGRAPGDVVERVRRTRDERGDVVALRAVAELAGRHGSRPRLGIRGRWRDSDGNEGGQHRRQQMCCGSDPEQGAPPSVETAAFPAHPRGSHGKTSIPSILHQIGRVGEGCPKLSASPATAWSIRSYVSMAPLIMPFASAPWSISTDGYRERAWTLVRPSSASKV